MMSNIQANFGYIVMVRPACAPEEPVPWNLEEKQTKEKKGVECFCWYMIYVGTEHMLGNSTLKTR